MLARASHGSTPDRSTGRPRIRAGHRSVAIEDPRGPAANRSIDAGRSGRGRPGPRRRRSRRRPAAPSAITSGEPSSGTILLVVVGVAHRPAAAARHPDVDRDGPLDRGRIAPDVAAAASTLSRSGATPAGRVVGVGVPRVPGLDVGHRDPEHPRPVRADQERRPARPRAARQELAVAGLVEPPVEVDLALVEQRPDDRERLLEPVDPVVEREAERPELRLVPAGARGRGRTGRRRSRRSWRPAWRAGPGCGSSCRRRAARASTRRRRRRRGRPSSSRPPTDRARARSGQR